MKKVLSVFLLIMAFCLPSMGQIREIFDSGESCLGAFAYGNSNLERASGAVARGKEAGECCLEIVVEGECSTVKACASFFGEVCCGGASKSDKESVEFFFGAVFVVNALELTFANERLQVALFNANIFREGCCRFGSVG